MVFENFVIFFLCSRYFQHHLSYASQLLIYPTKKSFQPDIGSFLINGEVS